MECKSPYFDHISNCTTAVTINAHLTPNTNYQWVISDKFNNEYAGVITTDDSGNFEIDVADLPEGLLNAYGGTFSLQVKEIYSCAEVSLNLQASYDSIIFTVKAGNRVKENLGCDFICTPSSSNGRSIFPFTDETAMHIEWTALLSSLYGNIPEVQVYILIAPNTYQLTNVSIIQNVSGDTLESIDIDFGGVASGYVILL